VLEVVTRTIVARPAIRRGDPEQRRSFLTQLLTAIRGASTGFGGGDGDGERRRGYRCLKMWTAAWAESVVTGSQIAPSMNAGCSARPTNVAVSVVMLEAVSNARTTPEFGQNALAGSGGVPNCSAPAATKVVPSLVRSGSHRRQAGR
jgi:hypothetical protein